MLHNVDVASVCVKVETRIASDLYFNTPAVVDKIGSQRYLAVVMAALSYRLGPSNVHPLSMLCMLTTASVFVFCF